MSFADIKNSLQVKDNHLTIPNDLTGLPAVATALSNVFARGSGGAVAGQPGRRGTPDHDHWQHDAVWRPGRGGDNPHRRRRPGGHHLFTHRGPAGLLHPGSQPAHIERCAVEDFQRGGRYRGGRADAGHVELPEPGDPRGGASARGGWSLETGLSPGSRWTSRRRRRSPNWWVSTAWMGVCLLTWPDCRRSH